MTLIRMIVIFGAQVCNIYINLDCSIVNLEIEITSNIKKLIIKFGKQI